MRFFLFHLFLDKKVEPKVNHDQSRNPARTSPQHRLPEPDAAALIVDIPARQPEW